MIKTAARQCFFTRGYQTTNIADIAAAAAVAHGTFYVHFTNKAEILDELLAEFNDALADRLQPVFAAAASSAAVGSTSDWLTDAVRTTAEIFLDYWHEQRDFVRCYAERLAASSAPGPADRRGDDASNRAGGLDTTTLRDGINPPMFALLTRALTAVAAHRMVIGNLELVTQGLLAMWLRIGMQYLFNPRVSRDHAVDALVRMSLGAVNAVLSDPTPTAPSTGAHEDA